MYILIIHLMKTLTETNAQLWREVVIWSWRFAFLKWSVLGKD
jgi:hypothetical protein